MVKISDLKLLIAKVVSDATPTSDTKKVLSHLASKLSKLKNNECLEVCQYVID